MKCHNKNKNVYRTLELQSAFFTSIILFISLAVLGYFQVREQRLRKVRELDPSYKLESGTQSHGRTLIQDPLTLPSMIFPLYPFSF